MQTSGAPLHPVTFSPAVLFGQFGVSGGTIMTVVLYTILGFWAVYTLVVIYHWLKYSHASSMAFPAIGIHLLVSFALISYMLSGSAFFLGPYLP